MMDTMKKFIPLLLLTLSLQALQSRSIESIKYHSQQGSTIALINLSDGSTWKWLPDFYSENLIRTWREGDEVTISVGNQPGFLLKNLSKPLYEPTVALSFTSYTLFPSIEYIEEETISLSDGSHWKYIFDFNKRTLRYWKQGDRIIPVEGSNKNFVLINLDIPHGNRGQIERQIDVLPSQNP